MMTLGLVPTRSGKLDLLFRIRYLLDLCAGGRPLFTILYQQMLCPQQIYGIMAIKSGRVIAWKVIMTVRALM